MCIQREVNRDLDHSNEMKRRHDRRPGLCPILSVNIQCYVIQILHSFTAAAWKRNVGCRRENISEFQDFKVRENKQCLELDGQKAVSYTHLDVYKRQILYN